MEPVVKTIRYFINKLVGQIISKIDTKMVKIDNMILQVIFSSLQLVTLHFHKF